ncbi:sulfatase-like hydrolase/transferase, partial [uncultured Microbulbifer sp.]|uniref:sulfatase-like hydrolase/transferase n=1 Tax=uncultured Microbulbifer sp. TaxID=348147 RepID=UPI0025EC8047
SALAASGKLEVSNGLAASVATGASLPLMLNVVNEPGNLAALDSGVANLFRRAQEAGYKTFWISTQESKLLNGLDSQHIDVRITREDDPLSLSADGDRAALGWLAGQQWAEKNFVVLNLRTAHTPYADAYQAEPERYSVWPTEGGGISVNQRRSNAYDNALLYLDSLLADTIEFAQENFRGDLLWVFTSDHGQMLGENGSWGHNRLRPAVASVPMMAFERRDNPSDTPYRLPDSNLVSHYEMGRWLLGEMGFRLDNPNKVEGVHYFHNEKLYGDNLFQQVRETSQGPVFSSMQLVSGSKITADDLKQDEIELVLHRQAERNSQQSVQQRELSDDSSKETATAPAGARTTGASVGASSI